MPLYGRDYEQDLLKSCLAECMHSDDNNTSCSTNSLVLIQGESGIGKTSLVEECFLHRSKQQQQDDDADDVPLSLLYASGKCEELRQSIPLLALTEALDAVCEQIQTHFSAEQLVQLKQDVVNLTPQSKLVLRFKSIQTLLELSTTTRSPLSSRPLPLKRHESRSKSGDASASSSSSSSSFTQLKQELRDFFQAVTRQSPLVLFLDDIQWCLCKSTLEILQHLSDTVPHLLLIVAMRGDGNNYELPVQSVQSASLTPTTTLTLTHLSLNALHQLVLRILRDDKADDGVKDLVQLVADRTGGNPYFATQFLHALLDQQLVYYDALQWMYNVDTIAAETSVSDNIVDLLLRNIQNSLPPCAQQVLTVAAFCGSKFSTTVVQTVVLQLLPNDNENYYCSTETVESALQQLHDEGMLVAEASSSSSSRCKFAHDRIQQASYQLIPPEERQAFHVTIGRILLFSSMPNDDDTEDTEQWSLLTTEQFNHGIDLLSNQQERVAVAQLNLSSAHHACQKSAHSCAAMFCKTGLQLLLGNSNNDNDNNDSCCWSRSNSSSNYQLTKDLSILLAEMEFCLGHHEECTTLIHTLLTKLESLEERLPVLITQMEVLSSQGNLAHAMTVGRTVLHQLGHGLPTKISKRHVLMELLSTQRHLKGMTDDDDILVALPELTDTNTLYALQIMSLLGCYAYSADDYKLMLLLPLVEMKILLTRGVSPYAGDALASYGVLIGHLQQHKKRRRKSASSSSAFRFSQLSLALMERYQNNESHDSQTLLVNHFFLQHSKRPVHDSIDPLFTAYQLGMDAGDIHNASLAFLSYICCYVSCGLPLQPVVHDTLAFRDQLVHQSQDLVLEISDIICQSMLNLMGNNKNKNNSNNDGANNANDDDDDDANNNINNDDPLVLSGHSMNEETMLLKTDSSSSSSNFIRHTFYSQKAMLALYFGNYEAANDHAQHISTRSSCNFMAGPTSFLLAMSALGCLQHYNTTTTETTRKLLSSWNKKRRTLKRTARQHMRKLERWVQQGNPNVQHMLLILQAEEAHVNYYYYSKQRKRRRKRKQQKRRRRRWHNNTDDDDDDTAMVVKKMYDTAISVSLRSGFTHNAALANERCAVFYLQQQQQNDDDDPDNEWARYYLERALELFSEWGAMGKVNQMQHDYSDCLLLAESSSSGRRRRRKSTHVKGVSRFSLLDNNSSETRRVSTTSTTTTAADVVEAALGQNNGIIIGS